MCRVCVSSVCVRERECLCVYVYVGVGVYADRMDVNETRRLLSPNKKKNKIRKTESFTRRRFPVINMSPTVRLNNGKLAGRNALRASPTSELYWQFNGESFSNKFNAIRATTVELSNRNGSVQATGRALISPQQHRRNMAAHIVNYTLGFLFWLILDGRNRSLYTASLMITK